MLFFLHTVQVAIVLYPHSWVGFHFSTFQERAAGALANLAADDKCSMEVALAGGVHALVMLARNCKFEGVQEQVGFFPCLRDILWMK